MPDLSPEPFTDDRLREIATTGWTQTTARLASELLAARAYAAEAEAERNRLLAWQHAVADALGVSEPAGPGYPWHCEEDPSDVAEHARVAAQAWIDLAEVQDERDKGYRDRAEVIAVLATIFPSKMADPSDETGWPVLYLDTPEGQLSWHINPADLDLFHTEAYALALDEDPDSAPVWDGHTNEQKSVRLHRLATCYQPADFLVDQHESEVLRSRIAELEKESQEQVVYDVWLKCNRGINASDYNEFLEDFPEWRRDRTQAIGREAGQ